MWKFYLRGFAFSEWNFGKKKNNLDFFINFCYSNRKLILSIYSIWSRNVFLPNWISKCNILGTHIWRVLKHGFHLCELPPPPFPPPMQIGLTTGIGCSEILDIWIENHQNRPRQKNIFLWILAVKIFCSRVLLSFCPFVILSLCPFVLLSFCPFILL